MAKYIGKRIVPKHCGYWDQTKEYEMLSIVLERSSGDSYISRRTVPSGTALTDETFWSPHSRYSQQIKNMSDQLAATEDRIKQDNDETEIAIRADNSSTKQAMESRVISAEAAMSEQKASFDQTAQQLNTRMDAVLAAGTGTGETEIRDARVTRKGKTFESMGTAIREGDAEVALEMERRFDGVVRMTDYSEQFVQGSYIATVASSYELDPDNEVTDSKFAHILIPVIKGHLYTIIARTNAGGARRVYNLAYSNYVVYGSAGAGVSYPNGITLKAREDGYLVVNALKEYEYTLYERDSTLSVIKPIAEETSESFREIMATGTYSIKGEWMYGGYLGFNDATNRCKTREIQYAESDLLIRVDDEFYAQIIIYDASDYAHAKQIATTAKDNIYRIPKGTYFRPIIGRGYDEADLVEWPKHLHVSGYVSDDFRLQNAFTTIGIFDRVGIIGDSYACGSMHWSVGSATLKNLSWGKILSRRVGNECVLYAHGGYGIRTWLSDEDIGLPKLLSDTPCNLYWWGMGINDYNGANDATKRGTMEDITEYESYEDYPDTLYGNYGRAIEQVMAYAPFAKHVICSCFGSTRQHVISLYKNINTVLREVAEHYGIPFINLMDDAFYRSEFYEQEIAGNHPTIIGYGGVALANERLLSKCIVENCAYFKDYGRTS